VRLSELELSINWVRKLLPNDNEIVVVGSQSILGSFNEVLLPDDARLSMVSAPPRRNSRRTGSIAPFRLSSPIHPEQPMTPLRGVRIRPIWSRTN
jgi:hypothetical protein